MDNHLDTPYTTTFNEKTDVTEQLLHRYGKSSASQHRHLCATAAATRSIIVSESLPLTPLSYFAATISTLSDKTLDTDALSALSSLLSIVLPLVPDKAIAPDKAAQGISALLDVLEWRGKGKEAALGTSSARALVKCLGLLLGFCDSEDWDLVKLGFQTLLKYSTDKRPKVRKCAQDCLLTVFKSFGSSSLSQKASKSVYSLLNDHMPLAVKLNASKTSEGSKDDILSKPEHQEVLHVLNVLKSVVPYLTSKICSKILCQLLELLTSQFSAMTRHIFDIIGVIFDASRAEVVVPVAENIIKLLVSYISVGEKKPVDTVLFASTLAKRTIDKLHSSETSEWINDLSLVIGSIAGLLTYEASSALQASNILKELITQYIETADTMMDENQVGDDEAICNSKVMLVKSTCAIFANVLSTTSHAPNEHVLAVISVLFLKLGSLSDIYLKDIVLKLAGFLNAASDTASNTEHLRECIGSAIVAMGPEKLLELLPICFAEDLSCSNTWLIPLLRRYVVGSSLGFFMQHVIPLAESFQHASHKVKKSEIGKDLQAYARDLWGLLPAFCHYPTDVYKNLGALIKILIPFLKKDSFMLENVAIALQEMINQNRSVLISNQDSRSLTELSEMVELVDSGVELKRKPPYSKKIASKNLRALKSCSEELLQALTDVLFETPPKGRNNLKDTIQCLASITESSVTRKIFVSSLERFQLVNDSSESEGLEFNINATSGKEENSETSISKEAKRRLILELASSFVEGADEDLVNLLFSFSKKVLEATDGIGHIEAYQALSKLLEKHSWFCSSQFVGLVDLLLGVKSPAGISSIESLLACFKPLLIHAVKGNLEEENTKAFLILNQILLMLKDSKDEGRKAAYDALIGISTSLRVSSRATPDGPHHKLITMIMGYLSGSSPHVKSGAVSALSVLAYNDLDICLSIPDLIPSVLGLLQLKAVEVIKAVLGFVKVLVSSLETKDLQSIATEIVNGILPWSSVSRNHFRSKVTVILEIMMRKCGSAAVKELVPEKYKYFVNSVSENRHGKTSSMEASTMDSETKHSDLSFRRQQKTKHTESSVSPKEGSEGFRKRKRENKQGNITGSYVPRNGGRFGKPANRAEQSGRHSLERGRPQQHGRDKRSNSYGWASDGKRKERPTSVKKNKGHTQKSPASSKLKKQNKFGNRKLINEKDMMN